MEPFRSGALTKAPPFRADPGHGGSARAPRPAECSDTPIFDSNEPPRCTNAGNPCSWLPVVGQSSKTIEKRGAVIGFVGVSFCWVESRDRES